MDFDHVNFPFKNKDFDMHLSPGIRQGSLLLASFAGTRSVHAPLPEAAVPLRGPKSEPRADSLLEAAVPLRGPKSEPRADSRGSSRHVCLEGDTVGKNPSVYRENWHGKNPYVLIWKNNQKSSKHMVKYR
jgi:hypothetical protein